MACGIITIARLLPLLEKTQVYLTCTTTDLVDATELRFCQDQQEHSQFSITPKMRNSKKRKRG
jgi:hypothetical protein